jgi:hypothetical protein
MKTKYERRAEAIAALKQGEEPLRFTGCDHNGDEWVATVHVNEEGAWQVDTTWGPPTHQIRLPAMPPLGEMNFHLRREFTKPGYAHDHLLSNNR